MQVITRKPQVFMLHFAGGNCYSFEFIRPYLNDTEFIPLELPGRGKRIHEPLLNDFNEAAEDLCRQILKLLKSPNYVIFGHSLGAILALKLGNLLEQMQKPPAHIVVSGNSGPGIKDYGSIHTLSKKEFREELKKQGGFSFEFFNVDELFDFFEPIIRADFKLARWDALSSIRSVNVPIFALAGSDEEASRYLDNWKNFTSSYFNAEILSGDHFFIHKHPQRIADIIKTCLT